MHRRPAFADDRCRNQRGNALQPEACRLCFSIPELPRLDDLVVDANLLSGVSVWDRVFADDPIAWKSAEPVGRCVASGRGTVGLGDADEPGSQRRIERWDRAGERTAGATGLGHWDAFDLIPCRDGKSRRVEPGTFPLAHGVPNRVGLLRGYGNAIVPQVAAEFIAAYLEAVPNG